MSWKLLLGVNSIHVSGTHFCTAGYPSPWLVWIGDVSRANSNTFQKCRNVWTFLIIILALPLFLILSSCLWDKFYLLLNLLIWIKNRMQANSNAKNNIKKIFYSTLVYPHCNKKKERHDKYSVLAVLSKFEEKRTKTL